VRASCSVTRPMYPCMLTCMLITNGVFRPVMYKYVHTFKSVGIGGESAVGTGRGF
jgi:hypothetical protein